MSAPAIEDILPVNMIDEAMITDLFTYHAPDAVQMLRYGEVREAAKHLARKVLQHCPASADRTAAVRKIREAIMTANAAIAMNGRNL